MQEPTEKPLKSSGEVWFFLDLTHLHLEDYFGCIVMVHTNVRNIFGNVQPHGSSGRRD